MFPPCLSFPRFGSRNPLCQLGGVQVFTNRLQVRTTAVTSMFTLPPSGRSAPSFRDPQETRARPPRRSGVLHAPPNWKQSKMPKVGTSKATELGDRAEEGG